MEITQNSNNLLQRENCFKHSIQMAFQDLISWPTLISILEDMTPTFVECKQLVKVLLNELQTLKQQKKVGNFPGVRNMNHQELNQEKASEDIEILEEESKLDDPEMPSVQDPITQDFDHENDTSEIYESLEIDLSCPRKSEARTSTNTREVSNVAIELLSEENGYEEDPRNTSRISKLSHIEKNIECKICKNKFSRSANLKAHEKVHTGEKPFECETCNKMFTRANELKKHERIHTGEKPFECKTCKKSFSTQFALKTHERRHTGEKPYKCKTCKKEFAQSNNLKEHERIHTGEKPFECSYCKKSFAQSSNLKKHIRIHTTVHR